MSNSNHTRGFLPLGVSRKREAGSGSEVGFKRPPKRVPPSSTTNNSTKEAAAKRLADLKRASENRVLAGYMANEFLTKGTLFGQKYDPARAEATPVAGNNRGRAPPEKKEAASGGAAAGKPPVGKNQSYAEVTNLLKSNGTHIPGIVNPTQLAQWLQM